MCFTSLFTGNCKNWLFFHLFGCSAARSSDYLEWIWMDGRELTNILFSFKVLQKAILLFKANGCNMWLSSSVYFVQNIKISILTDHLSKLGLLSKHLKGQSGPTVSDKKCVFVTFLLITAPPPSKVVRANTSETLRTPQNCILGWRSSQGLAGHRPDLT